MTETMTTKPPCSTAAQFPWGPLRITERFSLPELELLRRLHPAVARPGRCAARIEFEPFDEAEATAWPAARALPAEGGGALTLAHLFAYVHGYEMEPEPERAVGFGA